MTSTSSVSAHRDNASVHNAERTQNALLVAQEQLYTALRRPQPGRERAWGEMVWTALSATLQALREHRLEVQGPEGLYSAFVGDTPASEARVRQIKAQLERAEAEAIDLQIEVARVVAGDNQPLPVIRTEAERILLSLRDVLNKESDLIYERFDQAPRAFDTD